MMRAVGIKLGPEEVMSTLGAGGMGEVYNRVLSKLFLVDGLKQSTR
jgi:hypothetical protein